MRRNHALERWARGQRLWDRLELMAARVGGGPHGATVRLRVLWVRLWWGRRGVHGLIWRARTAWRPAQPVLWGGRLLIDWQVGSPLDRRLARRARQAAAVRRQQEAMLRVSIAFGEAFSAQLRAAERAIAQLGRSLERAGVRR